MTEKPPFVLHTKSSHDLRNHHTRREVAGFVYIVAVAEHDGRLCPALMSAEKPYNWYPTIDKRTVEGKELVAAESAMFDAIARFDAARLAAHAKARLQPIAKRGR